jgi:hypothetical protein
VRFGQKKSEAPEEVDSDGMYLRGFKDGDLKVRFLQECDDWIVFREHYNKERRSFPCTGDKETCPGCTSEDDEVSKSSRKYATNVHVVKANYVAPYRIPITLAKRMFARSERNEGTITNRDYIISRSGKGLETEYDVEADDKYEVNIKALLKDGQDIEEILERAFEDNAPGQPKKSSSLAREKAQEEEPPSDPEPKSESAGDSGDDEVIDEDALFEMTISDLKALAAKAGIDVPSTAKKSSIIRLLLDEAGV